MWGMKEGAWKWRAATASEESVAVCCSVLPCGSVRCSEVLRGFWCTLCVHGGLWLGGGKGGSRIQSERT